MDRERTGTGLGNPAELARRLVAPYRGLGPSLWSMFFATMINRFGDFVGPFLALYLTRKLGFDAATSGRVVSFVFLASMVGSLSSGRIADTFGRKRALILAHGGTAFFYLLAAFLYTRPWASGLLVLASLFGGGARPLIGALLTDLAPPERRKEVFGLQYWSINVGVALGPLVAAFLFDRAMPLLFAGDALFIGVSVALIALGVRLPAASHVGSSLERHDERGAVRAFVGRPILLALAVLALASSLTYSQTGFSLPLTISAVFGDSGPTRLAWMISLNAILVIVLSIPIARILRGVAPIACMALSGAFYVVGFGMLALPLGLGGFALSTAIWTVGEIVASVNFGVVVARHSPANWRASFQSFMGVFFSGGWMIGPLLAGPIIKSGGHARVWTATAALCAVWALAAIFVDRWDRRIQPEED